MGTHARLKGCTVHIKLFDGMIRELKDVRYVPQLKKNLISVGTLEALKMSSGSLVVLKGLRRNNLYYLKGRTVTENLTASEHLEDNSTRLWQMRLVQVGLNFLEAFEK